MDIQELKQLLKHSVSVLILENGEPTFVVVDYEVYKRLLAGSREPDASVNRIPAAPAESAEQSEQPTDPRELEILERLNKEILALKSQIELEEKGLSSSEDSSQADQE